LPCGARVGVVTGADDHGTAPARATTYDRSQVLTRVLERTLGAGDAILASLNPSSAVAAQRRGLGVRDHRPWPLPNGPWIQGQTWLDLLFAHWSLPAEALRPAVPVELPVDTFDGRAWLSITPFEVMGVRVQGMPPVPGLSRFPETNVRTYTTVEGKPGIYFLSLDAASWLAVAGARRTYRLPYHRADMAIKRAGEEIDYRSRRAEPQAELVARYRPDGAVLNAQPGTLEYFLTERYCLYVLDERHRILRADIRHAPWPLQPAVAELERNTMTAPYGIELDGEPLLHFSRRQDVVIWPLRA
jgi:uncharacterized protein